MVINIRWTFGENISWIMQTTLAPPLKGPGFNVQAWQEIYVELTTTKVKRKNYETLQMMSA
jgi:hypothetical protein